MSKTWLEIWIEALFQRTRRDARRADIARLRLCGWLTVHESAHVIVSWFSPFVSSITSVNVSDSDGGQVVALLHFDCPPFDWDILSIDLAGIAGELSVFDTFNPKKSRADLLSALEIAERLRMRCVEPETAMLWKFRSGAPVPDFAQVFRETKPRETLKLMKIGYWHAREVILDKWPLFMRLAEELTDRKTLDECDLEKILGAPTVMDEASVKFIRSMY